MANRSYLYSVNDIPTVENREGLTLKGISESNYTVPPLHLTLIGNETQICPSFFRDKAEALVGNYEKGVDSLKAFFTLMRKNGVDLPGLFEEKVSESLKFLEKADRKQKYFLLEPFEIFDLGDGPFDPTINTYKDLSEELSAYIKNSDFEGVKKIVGDDILTRYDELLGFGSWSEVLYWSKP